ncbi:MAG: hypothetical protein AB8B64_25530 [Granulosicoccus sp.]
METEIRISRTARVDRILDISLAGLALLTSCSAATLNKSQAFSSLAKFAESGVYLPPKITCLMP